MADCNAVRTVTGEMRCISCGMTWDHGDTPPCSKIPMGAPLDRLADLIDIAERHNLPAPIVAAMQQVCVELAMRGVWPKHRASPMVENARNVIRFP